MKSYRFRKLLQRDGWRNNVIIHVDDKMTIRSIEDQQDSKAPFQHFLIPGFPNAHSHAFQYAMAGQTEFVAIGKKEDSFWSWREKMYELALDMTPEKMEEVATDLYRQMRSNGYTKVCEFHYLHHQKDGSQYDDLAEMGKALMKAAQTAGISMTLLPMFYQKGGFGEEALEHQRRFISKDLAEYKSLLDATVEAAKSFSNTKVGMGIHSLRAADLKIVKDIFELASPSMPKHIHIAEQPLEIDDCLKFTGKRPVEWLFENTEVNKSFHLVHSTHINEKEIQLLADAQANVVLCPSTEGNLGDGHFPLLNFIKINGNFSIGSDSHIGLNPCEELRWLDYQTRLFSNKRNPLCLAEGMSSANFLFDQVWSNGNRAAGFEFNDYFEVGQKLEGIVLNEHAPQFKYSSDNNILSSYIYCGGQSSHLEII